MDTLLSQDISPGLIQHTPLWLVYSNELLELSLEDLQTRLRQEVAANPALELEERLICPSCGRALRGQFCPHCPASSATSTQQDMTTLDWEKPLGSVWGSIDEEEEVDPFARYAAPLELREALAQALQAELPNEAAPIIEYLVGNLDEEGYLRCTVEETAQVLKVPLEEVEHVLARLQAQEPSGIGARNVRECLLLQLRHLEAQGQSQPYALEIVEHFLRELSQRKYDLIAKQLGISRRQIEAVHAFLKNRLTPFPASSTGGAVRSMEAARPEVVVPQVIIRRQQAPDGSPYTVEVVEAERFRLRMNPAYVEAYQQLRGQQTEDCRGELAYIKQSMNHAHLVMISLQRRWQTLERITRHLVQEQRAYLEQGNAALRPLTRAEVATALGLHPSTVSRAVADKYVLLPNKTTIPFDTFFQSNLPIKEALKNLLAQETQPQSDQRLAELLAQQGIQVARRTVAKYREELRFPASCRR